MTYHKLILRPGDRHCERANKFFFLNCFTASVATPQFLPDLQSGSSPANVIANEPTKFYFKKDCKRVWQSPNSCPGYNWIAFLFSAVFYLICFPLKSVFHLDGIATDVRNLFNIKKVKNVLAMTGSRGIATDVQIRLPK